MDLQVIREPHVADQVGDQREHPGGDDGGHDRQAIQPIGQVHRIARPDHHEHADQRKREAERDQHLLEHRDREPGAERAPRQQGYPHRAAEPQRQLRDQLAPGRDALGIAPRQLQEIIHEADRAIAQRQQQHGPHITVREVRPDQCAGHQRRQDQHAAHGGRALLFDQVAGRAVFPDRLAAILHRFQPADHRGPKQQGHEQRGQAGGTGADRRVTEQVRQDELARKLPGYVD